MCLSRLTEKAAVLRVKEVSQLFAWVLPTYATRLDVVYKALVFLTRIK